VLLDSNGELLVPQTAYDLEVDNSFSSWMPDSQNSKNNSSNSSI